MSKHQDEPTIEAPASMNNLIDREEMLTIYRNDLKAVQEAKERAQREFYVLAGKEEALAALISYHESQKAE